MRKKKTGGILAALKIAYPHAEVADLEKEIEKAPDADWIQEATKNCTIANDAFSETGKNECPSKFFPGLLSRRMVCYWRKAKEGDLYNDARMALQYIVYPKRSRKEDDDGSKRPSFELRS